MTLKRTTFLTSGFLFISFFLLLICGLALPASAGSQRSHKAFTSTATLSYATVLRGRASWYGREHQGMRTSSGERFNRFKYTCAHKTLPFGTRLRVTNVTNGKSVVVRVSDRGPFRHQRILDLAEVAARPLNIVNQGAANVIAQVVPATTPLGPAVAPGNLLAIQAADPNPAAAFATYELPKAPDSATVATAAVPAITMATRSVATAALAGQSSAACPAPSFLAQAGTFADSLNAQVTSTRLLALEPTSTTVHSEEILDGIPLKQVLISPLDTWLAAEALRRRLQAQGVASLVRQVPSAPTVAMTAAAPGPPTMQ